MLDGVPPRVSGKLNPSFPWTRSVYNVVKTTKLSAGAAGDKALISLFKGKTSAVCTAKATIQLYGFALNTNCGAITLKAKQ